MAKEVLFVDDHNSFLTKAIVNGMKEEGYNCLVTGMNIGEISRLSSIPSLIYMALDENSKDKTDVLVYLRDVCMEQEKLIFLMGYSAELTDVRGMLPGEIVGGIFERPVNAKEISEKLMEMQETAEEANQKKSILVVDDSGNMLRTIKSWLDQKYRVAMANSAVNAVSYLANNTPDLILLDYEMPVCSGPQMLEMLRAELRTESIPVIFLTSKGDRESVQSVLSLKPQGYLLKTQSPEQIVETIDQFFEKQKAEALAAKLQE